MKDKKKSETRSGGGEEGEPIVSGYESIALLFCSINSQKVKTNIRIIFYLRMLWHIYTRLFTATSSEKKELHVSGNMRNYLLEVSNTQGLRENTKYPCNTT